MRRRRNDDRHPDAGAGTQARADHDHEQADDHDEHDVDRQLDDIIDDHVDEGGQRRQRQWGHRQRLTGFPMARKPAIKPGLGSRNAA